MATIVVLGAGMMGTALAWPLTDRGHRVRLVGTHLDTEIVHSLRERRHHPTLDLTVPDGIEALPETGLAEALQGADAVALGVSSAGVRWAAKELRSHIRPGLALAMVTKGLVLSNGALGTLQDLFLSELSPEVRGALHPVAIAGPCIAGELARRVPTSVVFAARDEAAARAWADLARGPYYRVRTSSDLLGVEICAATKNAYAMGVAFGSGLIRAARETGGSIAYHNYEASVFAQAIWEMRQWIGLYGGDPESALWLPGVGDLDVTNAGGRTGRFGALLGEGLGTREAVERMQGATLECLEVLGILRDALAHLDRAGRLGPTDLPLARHLCEVALQGAPIQMPLDRFFSPLSR